MHTVIKQCSDRLRKPVDETFATPAGTTPDEWRGPHCVDRGVSAPSHIAHGTYCGARGRSSQHERAALSSSRPYRHRQLAAKRPLLHSNCLTSTFLLIHRLPFLLIHSLPVTELWQSLYMAEKNSQRAFSPPLFLPQNSQGRLRKSSSEICAKLIVRRADWACTRVKVLTLLCTVVCVCQPHL